ncbi:MAG: trypsin-like peptidase domain-containing protein, partial [Mycobacteriales bacterium]
LNRSPLKFAGPVDTGASAIVAGYPEDGPFNAVPARVRVREEVRGPDIYQNRQVTRQVYALRSTVQPGNSGGPLLSPSGGVYGVVFAASTTDPQTGYALTAAQVASDAQSGSSATAPVSTEGCD